ncbi:hypothetical protein Naga_100787g1, partial [Nannochloropsis gaditana]
MSSSAPPGPTSLVPSPLSLSFTPAGGRSRRSCGRRSFSICSSSLSRTTAPGLGILQRRTRRAWSSICLRLLARHAQDGHHPLPRRFCPCFPHLAFPLLLLLCLLCTHLSTSKPHQHASAFLNAPLHSQHVTRLSTPARHGPIISPLSAPARRHAPLRRSRPLPPLFFSPALLNVGTPEAALILLVGYFVLGPQDLYRVAKEVGQLLSNLQTAGSDAWKVFQEAMEAEGTMAAMGASVNEINNVRQNFFQKFLDVRAERTLDQLEEKGVDVEALTGGMGEEDEWGNRLKEVQRRKEEEAAAKVLMEAEDEGRKRKRRRRKGRREGR